MGGERSPVNAVVDTNVIAYYLLATEPFVEEVQTFWHGALDVIAPALWEAELANVLWMAARSGVVPPDVALERLGLAAQLGIRSVPIRLLWRGALVRAMKASVAVYDTLFVELATRERLPLVTFDAKVLAAFPDVAIRPKELLVK